MSVSLSSAPEASALLGRYREIRATTEALCRPLQVEDYVLQANPLRPQCYPVTIPAGGAPSRLEWVEWEWTQRAYLPYPGFKPMDARPASTTASS